MVRDITLQGGMRNACGGEAAGTSWDAGMCHVLFTLTAVDGRDLVMKLWIACIVVNTQISPFISVEVESSVA